MTLTNSFAEEVKKWLVPEVKLRKLNQKGFKCWVVGGNHSYQAVMKVRAEVPGKKFMDQVLVQIWWFEDEKDPDTIEKIEYLAAHHNLDQEFRKNWTFTDKLNFLRRKYIRNNYTWTAECRSQAAKSLGTTEQSLNPLLQLVGGSKEKWNLLDKIISNPKEKVHSDAKFRCLQGAISEDQCIKLLRDVAEEKITLEQMKALANDIKLDIKIKQMATTLLNCKNFKEVKEKYGKAFTKSRRSSFIPAFALKKKRGKARTSETELSSDVPESFAKYVEQVRVSKGGFVEASTSNVKPFQIGNTQHWVYQVDVAYLSKLVEDRKKFESGTCPFILA